MPLYVYQCKNCEWMVEKFLHNRKNTPELVCEECGGEEFDRVIGMAHTKMMYNAKETFEKKISPDVEKIQKKIADGSDKDFLDIAGD